MTPDVSFFHSFLSYDAQSGLLTWKPRTINMIQSGSLNSLRRWNTRFSGKPITAVRPDGYISTTVNGVRYMAHRLAWVLYHNKPIPEGAQIDHVNSNRSDNRIENLRLCTPHQNQANINRQSNGAQYRKSDSRWQASIRIHLGVFDTEEAANAAYDAAAKKLHGQFFRPNGTIATASRVL